MPSATNGRGGDEIYTTTRKEKNQALLKNFRGDIVDRGRIFNGQTMRTRIENNPSFLYRAFLYCFYRFSLTINRRSDLI
jgi:hypothetical protein